MDKKSTKLSDFQAVFQKGSQKSKGSVIVRFLRNHNEDFRWGVAVSSKRWKKAVERNRIKRVVREAARPLFSLLEGKDMDVVFLYRGGSPNPKVDDLRKDIYDILITLS